MFRSLWKDEQGFVVSAELILLSTLGVIGGVVGLKLAATAVNAELTDVAHSIRSLDQSYSYGGMSSCRAWTAGSCFVQQDVDVSLQELGVAAELEEERLRDRLESNEPLPLLPEADEDRESDRLQRLHKQQLREDLRRSH